MICRTPFPLPTWLQTRRRSALSLVVVFVVLTQILAVAPAVAGETSPPVVSDSSTESPGTVLNETENATYVSIESVSVNSTRTFTYRGTTAVWETDDLWLQATVRTHTEQAFYDVCVNDYHPSKNRLVECKEVGVLPTGKTVEFGIDLKDAPSGRHRFVASINLSDRGGSANVDPTGVTVYVFNRSADLDDDKLTNAEEVSLGLNLTNSDTDGDGLVDGAEVTIHGTNASLRDTDGDGLPDNVEVNGRSNATRSDTDGDGLDDGVELNNSLDPTDPDTDGDNLTDATELAGPTNPAIADTDGDGLLDGRELELGSDPTVPDTDGDGVTDGQEVRWNLDPTNPDTDGDMLRDGLELMIGLDPTSAIKTVLVLLTALSLVAAGGYALYRSERVSLLERFDLGSEADGGSRVDGTSGPSPPPEPAAPETTSSDPPVELLTPPDRVLRILEENGGRIPQAEIVDRTDWSKAKVSRTLSEMEEDGQISRYRLGRGNVVTRPEIDPTEATVPNESNED